MTPQMKCPICAGTGRTRDIMFEEWDPCGLCKASGQVDPSAAFNNIGDSCTLIFKFPTKDAALAFKAYMSDGGGEYPWLEHQDELEPQDQVSEFVYHTGDNTIIAR